MIKLKPLMEMNKYGDQPSPLLKKYLLENKVAELTEYLYHGSPFDGLVQMLVHGFSGQEHGEVAEYESISTSLNSEILHYFSEGDGETGLQFHVKNAKVIVLDDIMTYLVTQLPGSGMSAEVDDEQKFEEFCQRFDIPVGSYRHVPHLPYGYLSSLGVDAFVYDYTWKYWSDFGGNRGASVARDEHEICFIGKGIERLEKSITTIYVDGEEFDKKLLALRAIKKKMHDKAGGDNQG
jgi:hypothetical protein